MQLDTFHSNQCRIKPVNCGHSCRDQPWHNHICVLRHLRRYAGQEGRPIHATTFKEAKTEQLKLDVGWTADYVSGGDAESERLFNFGILAPPLQCVSCLTASL